MCTTRAPQACRTARAPTASPHILSRVARSCAWSLCGRQGASTRGASTGRTPASTASVRARQAASPCAAGHGWRHPCVVAASTGPSCTCKGTCNVNRHGALCVWDEVQCSCTQAAACVTLWSLVMRTLSRARGGCTMHCVCHTPQVPALLALPAPQAITCAAGAARHRA